MDSKNNSLDILNQKNVIIKNVSIKHILDWFKKEVLLLIGNK